MQTNNMATEHISLSKLDVVREHIETAIHLFFEYKSPVAIHTLAAASSRVLKDLAEKKGGWFTFNFENYIKEEHLREYREIVNGPANYFKHADKDHDTDLSFNPQINEHVLWQSCLGYGELTGAWTPLMQDYIAWMAIFYPDFYKRDRFPEDMWEGMESFRKTMNVSSWSREDKQRLGLEISKFLNLKRSSVDS